MKTNNDNFTKKAKMRNDFPQKKSDYTCIFHCPITVNDCINSIDLKDDKVIIGTLMGDVFLCRVDESKLYLKQKNNKIISVPSLNLKNIKEKDESDIQLYINPVINKSECIKLSIKDSKINYNQKLNLNNDNMNNIYHNNQFETNKQNIIIKKEEKDNSLKFPKITQLIIRSRENIPCLEFESNDIINICIGDLEIIHLEKMSTFNKNDKNSTYNFSKLRNYKTENEHIEFCETATCFLKNSCFLIIFTKLAEFEDDFEIAETKYENKNLSSGEIIKGSMDISNYVIPFDFNGDMFLFVDYKSKEEKFIGIEYTITQKERYVYNIKDPKKFGHISHMKLIPNGKIFIIRNEIECEIRYINDDFDVIEKYEYCGIEAISCCFYKNEKEESYINLVDDIDYEQNDNNNKGEINKSNAEKIEVNIKRLFENKLNLKESKEKTNLINSKITMNNNNIYNNINNKSRMNKISKNLDDGDLNDVKIYGKIKKIISSFDNENNSYIKNNGKYSCIHTETSIKRKSLLFNSNSHLICQSSEKSSSSRKIINNYNYTMDNKKINKSNLSMRNNLVSHNKKTKIKNNLNNFSSIEIFEKNNKKNKLEDKKIEEDNTIMNHIISYRGYNIITLDSNGTVYLYHNNTQITLFNIYEINNIKQKFKNLQFFSMGFPYYIIANEKYVCITTDFGLFVFTKIEN
jgi:hypothetical protein